MKPKLTQREVNSLVMEAFRPAAELAEQMWGAECRIAGSPWSGFCWGAGAGRSLFDDLDGPVGVHVDGARGRMRFYLPYDVAYQVAERMAEDRPDVHRRINWEWWQEMTADARDDWRDDDDLDDDQAEEAA